MKIIVINGEARVGKDTFVHFCSQIEPYTVYNISIIDAVKTAAIGFDWSQQDKSEKARRFLSDLKDAWERFDDGPYQTMKWRIDLIKQSQRMRNEMDRTIVFIHSREPHDIERFVKDYNAVTLLIRREAVEGPHDNHADSEVYDWEYDWVIENNNLEDFKESAHLFVEEIMKEEDK